MWMETNRFIEGEVLHEDGSTEPSEILLLIDRKDNAWILFGAEENKLFPPSDIEDFVFFNVTLRRGSTDKTMDIAAGYQDSIIRFSDDASLELIKVLQNEQEDFTLSLSDYPGQIGVFNYMISASDKFKETFAQMKNSSAEG